MTITPESYIEKLGRENGRIVFAVLLKWIHAYSRFHDLRTVCTHSETQHLPTTMKQFYQRLDLPRFHGRLVFGVDVV